MIWMSKVADFVHDDVIDARQKTAQSYPRHKGLEDRMESKAAKNQASGKRRGEDREGSTALWEQSAVQKP
jgi:ribosomal protein L19E